jgi:glycosyltransferase involved in cell wall biosynthesis
VQKSAFLRDAAALLFPVQGEEAFGLVMIEAMACGTPVIAWHGSSVAEVVEGGKTGYYGDSVEELVKLVPNALALDRVLVRQLAQTRYGSERMVDEYLDAYCAVLNAGDRNPPANSSPKEVRQTQCAS